VRESAGLSREGIVAHLEKNGIQTRMLFAGNLIKHPCFDEMRAGGTGYRIAGGLANTDAIMERSFWLGVYPGMTPEMTGFVIDTIRDFARKI
jgi:CDP-6-deoxy-D-xylo-4-hexulose-3-dehydrase